MDVESLKQLLSTDKISRREFIQLTIASGMTVAAAETLFMQEAKAGPKRGGKIIVGGTMSTSESYDPGSFGVGDGSALGLYGAVYNNLLELGASGEFEGEIAESWEPSPDAKTWTFKLRKGVEFTNGKTVEAEDVVASLNHHRGEDSASAASGIVKEFTDVRADGKNTVVIELTAGNADLPALCSDYHLVMCPSKDGKIQFDTPIGTGAYTMETHELGVRMTLKRNPNYFKPDRGNFDEAEIVSIADPTAKNAALVSGSINVLHRAEVKTLPLLERTPNIAIDERTGTQHYTLPMRCDTAPFDNKDVRLALKHAINREEMLKTILAGHGAIANDSPITPANRYYDATLPQREYDLDKAKFHLKAAGMSTLNVDLHAADAAFNGAVDLGVLYKEHAKSAGININVVREPNDGYWSNVWMNKPWSACYWGGRPTEDWMFSLAYMTGAGWNDTFWSNKRFDELCIQARSELDQNKRREMYGEMQAIVRDDGGVVVPLYANVISARSTSIQHAEKISASFASDGWKCIERWWMA